MAGLYCIASVNKALSTEENSSPPEEHHLLCSCHKCKPLKEQAFDKSDHFLRSLKHPADLNRSLFICVGVGTRHKPNEVCPRGLCALKFENILKAQRLNSTVAAWDASYSLNQCPPTLYTDVMPCDSTPVPYDLAGWFPKYFVKLIISKPS